MRLVGTASLAVLLLLMSSAPAFAECAWVLWTRAHMTAQGRIDDFPVRAYSTKSECDARVGDMRKDDEVKGLSFVCLPDSIDPRGPKGGAR